MLAGRRPGPAPPPEPRSRLSLEIPLAPSHSDLVGRTEARTTAKASPSRLHARAAVPAQPACIDSSMPLGASLIQLPQREHAMPQTHAPRVSPRLTWAWRSTKESARALSNEGAHEGARTPRSPLFCSCGGLGTRHRHLRRDESQPTRHARRGSEEALLHRGWHHGLRANHLVHRDARVVCGRLVIV